MESIIGLIISEIIQNRKNHNLSKWFKIRVKAGKKSYEEDAPNNTLHPTQVPALLSPAPLTLRGESAAVTWAGECGVMRRGE